MADVRVSWSGAVPPAPDRYEVENERRFRAEVSRLSAAIDEALSAHKTDLLAALNNITDVEITGTPADNELLAYDSGSGEWINQTAAEAGLAAASHTHAAGDVTSGTFAVARIPDLSAAKITSGTLADGRLSSNIPLKNAANTFTEGVTISEAQPQLFFDETDADTYLVQAAGARFFIKNNDADIEFVLRNSDNTEPLAVRPGDIVEVGGTLKLNGDTVSLGAADSGGSGFKVLRVPN